MRVVVGAVVSCCQWCVGCFHFIPSPHLLDPKGKEMHRTYFAYFGLSVLTKCIEKSRRLGDYSKDVKAAAISDTFDAHI